MPEFILPAEADHCPHCNEVLREPPNCCEAMMQEYSEEMHRLNDTNIDDYEDESDLEEYYCYECDREIEECTCR